MNITTARVRSMTSQSLKRFGTEDQWIGQVVCHKYRILQKLNQGSFGKIYVCQHTDTGIPYAVKIEPCPKGDTGIRQIRETLLNEVQVLLVMKGDLGFPRLQYFTKDNAHNIMITTLLSKNLEQVALDNNKILSLKSIVYFALESLARLEHLHSKGFVHRDVKPDNFVLGVGETQHLVYLVDYGLTKQYREANGKHIEFNSEAGMVGTIRYASTYSLKGYEQSRRDDLISLGYTLIYLLTGGLPWMNLDITSKEDRKQRILHMKIMTSISDLCGSQPDEFRQYFSHCFTLKFDQAPDYRYLRGLFAGLAYRRKFDLQDPWDSQLKHQDSQLFPSKKIASNIQQSTIAVTNTLESLEKHLQKSNMGLEQVVIFEEQSEDHRQFESMTSESYDYHTSNQSRYKPDKLSQKLDSLQISICKSLTDVNFINHPQNINFYREIPTADEYTHGTTIANKVRRLDKMQQRKIRF